MNGGRGNDDLHPGPDMGGDIGGPGVDRLSWERQTGNVDVDLSRRRVLSYWGRQRIVGVEVVIGTAFRDMLFGAYADETLVGNGSGDIIDGRGGDDRLFAGTGKDAIRGGQGDDLIYDTHQGRIRAWGNGGNDVIIGTFANDTIRGGEGRDKIRALAGDDFLDGGPGNDLGNGGVGTDECVRSNGGGRASCS